MQTAALMKQKLWDDFIRLNPKGKLAAIPVNDSEWPGIEAALNKKLREIKTGMVIDAVYAGLLNLGFWTIFFMKYYDTSACMVIGDKWVLFLLISSNWLTILGRFRMYLKYQRLKDVAGMIVFLLSDEYMA
jgi:hypothetical protein